MRKAVIKSCLKTVKIIVKIYYILYEVTQLYANFQMLKTVSFNKVLGVEGREPLMLHGNGKEMEFYLSMSYHVALSTG